MGDYRDRGGGLERERGGGLERQGWGTRETGVGD